MKKAKFGDVKRVAEMCGAVVTKNKGDGLCTSKGIIHAKDSMTLWHELIHHMGFKNERKQRILALIGEDCISEITLEYGEFDAKAFAICVEEAVAELGACLIVGKGGAIENSESLPYMDYVQTCWMDFIQEEIDRSIAEIESLSNCSIG